MMLSMGLAAGMVEQVRLSARREHGGIAERGSHNLGPRGVVIFAFNDGSRPWGWGSEIPNGDAAMMGLQHIEEHAVEGTFRRSLLQGHNTTRPTIIIASLGLHTTSRWWRAGARGRARTKPRRRRGRRLRQLLLDCGCAGVKVTSGWKMEGGDRRLLLDIQIGDDAAGDDAAGDDAAGDHAAGDDGDGDDGIGGTDDADGAEAVAVFVDADDVAVPVAGAVCKLDVVNGDAVSVGSIVVAVDVGGSYFSGGVAAIIKTHPPIHPSIRPSVHPSQTPRAHVAIIIITSIIIIVVRSNHIHINACDGEHPHAISACGGV